MSMLYYLMIYDIVSFGGQMLTGIVTCADIMLNVLCCLHGIMVCYHMLIWSMFMMKWIILIFCCHDSVVT